MGLLTRDKPKPIMVRMTTSVAGHRFTRTTAGVVSDKPCGTWEVHTRQLVRVNGSEQGVKHWLERGTAMLIDDAAAAALEEAGEMIHRSDRHQDLRH